MLHCITSMKARSAVVKDRLTGRNLGHVTPASCPYDPVRHTIGAISKRWWLVR